MLVFRNSSAAPGKTRKNKGFSSIVKSQAKAAEQAEAEAMAQAQAQLDSRPKRRGRPSKAQREADEAQVRQAAATARSSSVLAPLTKPSLPRAQKSPDIAASVRRKAKQDIQATYAEAPLSVLRTAARVEDHRISQTQALAMIEAGDPALDEFATHLGPVVDGFIVDGMVNGRAWEAWVYRVSKRTPATSRALLDNVLPTGDVVESMALRANSRRNSNVSFRTRDGRKISFRARK